MKTYDLSLPENWPRHVRSAMLHIISLAHTAITYSRSWCANSSIARVRLAGKLDRAINEMALLKEEIRIKDIRMSRMAPHHRPFYPPTERMAILEVRAARGWNLMQTAQTFLLEPETISSWMKRVDEEGEHALVQLSQPVNKFPPFVRHIVQRLKVLCPVMGKKRIAEVLAHAGLHLAATTVQRFVKTTSPESLKFKGLQPTKDQDKRAQRVVTANHPNHVWHVDMTVVPIAGGFWTSWFPFSFLQQWPFCWWVAIIVDHFSRCVMGFAVFNKQPTSIEIRSFIGRVIHNVGKTPRYLICDKGRQFWCDGFKKWCKRKKIRPRYGAVGKYGSIAIIERFIRSIKSDYLWRILVPLRLENMRKELSLYVSWYSQYLPHQALNGRTPSEVYHDITPANEQPRFEPRANWPPESPCASPQAPIRGKPGAKFWLHISFLEGRQHLPVFELKEAA